MKDFTDEFNFNSITVDDKLDIETFRSYLKDAMNDPNFDPDQFIDSLLT